MANWNKNRRPNCRSIRPLVLTSLINQKIWYKSDHGYRDSGLAHQIFSVYGTQPPRDNFIPDSPRVWFRLFLCNLPDICKYESEG